MQSTLKDMLLSLIDMFLFEGSHFLINTFMYILHGEREGKEAGHIYTFIYIYIYMLVLQVNRIVL